VLIGRVLEMEDEIEKNMEWRIGDRWAYEVSELAVSKKPSLGNGESHRCQNIVAVC
jgi:hypothetical protein